MGKWAACNDTVEDEDLVLGTVSYTLSKCMSSLLTIFMASGLAHNPRIEDFPVMPMEGFSVMLKRDGFFHEESGT